MEFNKIWWVPYCLSRLIIPNYLLLKIKNLIASRVDKHTGKYTGLNCYHEEKVIRYKEIYNDTIVDEFYSDSLSDTPMAKLAKKAYFVSDGVVTDWKF